MGNRAFISGATDGIGKSYAYILAKFGTNLIICSRNENKLKKLSIELEEKYKIKCEYFVVDLSKIDEIKILADKLSKMKIDILINNAGFATMGSFHNCTIQSQIDMIHVHEIATTCLTHAVLHSMTEQNSGIIINVSSIASKTFSAGNCVYSASKSFITTFSQILDIELRNTNIKIQALCPGFTSTGFHEKDYLVGYNKSKIPSFLWDSPDYVVLYSFKALRSTKVIVIPGLKNKLLIFIKTNKLTNFLLRLFLRNK